MTMRWIALAICLIASPLTAVEPNEVLSDDVLESRARLISKELRCLVCRNESIDDSNATLAQDLRVLVRERLLEGDSDAEVRAFVVARYGEFVLLKPRLTGGNLVLWLSGPVLLVLLSFLAWRTLRSRGPVANAPLSADEAARLKELLDD